MVEQRALLSAQLQALGKIAVLYGGHSAEREVSLKSGQAVFEALQRLQADVSLLDLAAIEVAELTAFDCCFIALHGRGGEDGVIQGVLDHLKVPYTGSGVMASAIGMSKLATKLLWKGAGLPTPAFYVAGQEAEIGFPVMVKPTHEGSSIGMRKADNPAELAAAVEEAARYDREVLVEKWVQGSEYTVAILGDQALPPIRLVTPNTFYDYDAKYLANNTQYLCPCGLSAQQEAALKALALKAFHLVGARGWGRVDVMQDEAGNFFLLEINTVPGMTDHSLVPMAARALGMDFDQLVAKILLSVER